MLAAGSGDADMVKLLMENGASPAARTKRHKTFALWLAGKGGHVAVMQHLLGISPDSEAAQLLIEVDLDAQTATLSRDGVATESAPVSTGRKGFRTPAGEYVVTDKHRKWRSTLYPADMPFFMRLSCGEIGFHEGKLPGYPASHGCIRMRRKDAAEFFKQVPVGTKVVIK
jgi:lipoprotein-anchoring transpeptidase ErfK/SrfK